MAFNIYDETLTRVGEIKTILSSTWEERYDDRGICQLVVNCSAAASRLLTVGRFVGQSGKRHSGRSRHGKNGTAGCG